MQCKNHPEAPSVDRCCGCAEAFCGDCLVEVAGQKYCGSCKVLAMEGRQVVIEEATTPCSEANEALTYAILSLFCCGIILSPIAISKAHKAKQMISENPRLSGYGKANAAMIVGIVALVLWAMAVMNRATRTAHQY